MSAQQGMSVARRVTAAMLVVAAAATPAMAQNVGASGGRWAGWIGCWSAAPAEGASLLSGAAGPLVCITPTADANVVQVATISRDSVISTQQLDASGREVAIDAKGCSGGQRAHWSADERRVYLESSAVCEGVKRTTSGILSFAPNGDWLDVQSMTAGDGEQMHVVRYHDAGVPESLPASIKAAVSGRTMASQSARLAAGAAIGGSAVREAVKNASTGVVEAWLLERGQRFSLDANTLASLADAGVPSRVTDAMIAVSNPDQFSIAHGEATPQSATRVADRDTEADGRRRVYVSMQPWGWGYDPYYWYGDYWRPYYAYGYGYPYGFYGGYGYPVYGYTPPIVIVRGGQGETHGRLVKGRGYTPSTTAATPQTERTPAPPPRSASPSPSSSSSSGSSSSGSGSSSGRKAHEKP